MKQELNEDNFVLTAAKHYDCVFLNTDEFQEDIKRIAYIKRLFNSYRKTGDLKERLILNHLIVIYNVFGLFATKMLFFKLDDYDQYLKTFLTFLSYMPDHVSGIGREISSKEIPLHDDIWRKLHNL
jgi:hypothetical protein